MVVKKKKRSTSRKRARKPDLEAEIQRLREEVEARTSTKQYDILTKNIEDLNEQITKMVSININLQSKMTELLIKVTDLIRENRELVGLLEEASEIEIDAMHADAEATTKDLLDELKKVTKAIGDMSKSFSGVEKYIKRAYTKEMLSKAVGGKIEAPKETTPAKMEEKEKTVPRVGPIATPEAGGEMPKEVGGGTVGAL